MTLPFPVITGVGLVTPLARTAAGTWDALIRGRHVTGHTRLEPASDDGLPRVASLAVEAVAEAVHHAGWPPSTDAAVVGCTSKGPVEDWLATPAAPSDNANGGGGRSDLDRLGFGMGTFSAAVARARGGGPGPVLTVSAACAGGLQALARAALLIRAGEADRVIVVAAEASVLPMFTASFARLGVLPPPGELCRPFDVDRKGFLMSEAAAAICLERADVALGTPLVAVVGFALGADASHLTGVDPAGVALRRLLGGLCHDLDLVHAHGTGTELNDAAELAALSAGLPDGGAGTSLYSHKAGLGHSLGASGLVAVVLSCLAHSAGQVPPNCNTRRPMPAALQLSPTAVRRCVRRSVTMAAGFGGGIGVVRLATL